MTKTMAKLYISSEEQDKNWRFKNICSKKGQRDGGCEAYQRKAIEEITGKKCQKSNSLRINYETNTIEENKNPMTNKGKVKPDGLEWSEDFDGIQTYNTKKYLYNFKFIAEGGGAQTRSIRETYHFIKHQLKYIKKYPETDYMFVNILDGKYAFTTRLQFDYLLGKYNDNENKKCLVLDTKEFNDLINN